ncbi:Asp-tRNA(Asn)/Glu-tRNA(Gln) amidotransferase A subunit family amidase [Leifsonia sp. AK011]|uniref:amidase family protein n=1 Tax=Leifsonia sp. AK011 TaxID=2723075 RepID=UPI0017ECA598|nr:amidase family protein [Leifsonia sp. AK011]NYF10161.1 Asp-tRNA(Asn)/Glu-tRNA(Gln) amidotransferase A subunit family amidase [Leifsonia sp. AK011]
MTTRRIRTAVAATTGIVSLVAVGALAATPAVAATDPAPLLMPFYTELDVTGDSQVTTADLDLIAANLGATPESASWSSVQVADVDENLVITVTDLAAVSQRMVYDDGDFEIVEASVIDMQAAMNAGVTTSVELTQAYFDRIAAYDKNVIDQGAGGRQLNSIMTTSSVALAAAAAADAERAESGMTSTLLGIPVALKDNYNTLDMPTTAGCDCWVDNQTDTDAYMVEGLREAGAVILAKATLDEWAYGFSSAYSVGNVAGIPVANPYNTTKTAGGSSGGTGAAIAANLAGVGFGTDTGGSIRVPSSYNQLVGIRPSVGLASRDGIVPLALSQDTGGPITRSVTDAAIALDAVTGIDENDPVTAAQAGLVPDSYTEFLDADSLYGARIGYVQSMIGSNATTVRLWNEAKARMEAMGATVVPITAPSGFPNVLNEGSGSKNEFKHDLNIYIAEHLAPEVTLRSLTSIIESGRLITGRIGTYVERDGITEQTYQNWAGPTGTHTTQLAAGRVLVTGMLNDPDGNPATDDALDAIVYPSGNPYSTQSTNLRLSPNTGLPSVTVPMGQATAEDGSTMNVGGGVNLEFLGRMFDEGTLLGLTYAFEQETQARTSPTLYGPLPE